MNENFNKYDKVEILSPAGSAECFYADINAGADAIYLGLSNFNARMKAENFTTENIREFVKFAHLMGVKIYVTVNTLIEDENFSDLIEMVKVLVDAKVDAYIIQDLGVAHILRNSFENIELHASTQLAVHNLEGALVAEKLGFKRVVLSREAKLEDIRLIHKNTNLEIEYFVQGALCVAFSGNCYLSALEKGQSGNEGKCLQLCRLPYTDNLKNETAYYLSARDLSLLENLEKLIDAGVTSFKIEGRMRHAGYCAITANTYKTAINKLKTGTLDKKWIDSQKTLLRETFSRGEFNENAYLDSQTPDKIIYKDYQNHIGLEIGTVISSLPFKNNLFKVRVKSNKKLESGDGIKIIDKKTKTQIASLGIGDAKNVGENIYEFVTKYKFSSGNAVFLTQNSTEEKKYLDLKRKLNINIFVTANSGEKLIAKCCYGDFNFKLESDFTLEKAKNSPISPEDFAEQFKKTADTNFNVTEVQVKTDGVFIPKSMLNGFRRTLLANLTEEIISNYEKNNTAHFVEEKFLQTIKTDKSSELEPLRLAIINENFDEKISLEGYDKIIFAPSVYTETAALNAYKKFGEKFALLLPTIANYNDMTIINDILNKLPNGTSLYSNNLYGMHFAEKFNVICSPLQNVKNKMAINSLVSLGAKSICSSIEQNVDYAESHNLISFAEGNFPLMTFAHCPFKTIYENSCKTCKFSSDLSYKNSTMGEYKVTRRKIFNCYFELNKYFKQKKSKFFVINYNK